MAACPDFHAHGTNTFGLPNAAGLDYFRAIGRDESNVRVAAMRCPRHRLADVIISRVVKADYDMAHVNTNASSAPSVPMMATAQNQTMM